MIMRATTRFPLGLLVAMAVFLAGCQDREAVPGSIPSSGSLDEIINNAEGNGGKKVGQMGATPLTGWSKPTVQLVRNGESAPIWIFPEPIEQDQYGNVITKREGYWLYTFAKFQSYVDIDQSGNIDLKSLSNVEIGENGQVIIKHDASSQLDKATLQDMRNMAAGVRVPWTEGGKETSRTTTVIVDDGRGTPRGTTVPSQAVAPMVNQDGSVNPQAYQQAMRAAEERMKNLQQNQYQPQQPAIQGK